MVAQVMLAAPVIISHASGSYPVYVHAGALTRLPQLIEDLLPGRRVAMIADGRAHELYSAGAFGAASWQGSAFTFEPGERAKTRESWARITDALVDAGFGRDTGLIALGGGVAGDLAGFVAATYMRGVPYLQAPTTLLAMLDASVGGKTGLDTPKGKNLVGAFHQPVGVLADPQTLAPLPDRDYRAGLAEAVKHGLIADHAYFSWIESNAAALAKRDLAALTHLIRRSVEIKGEVVAGDEREAGKRAILNAGHTVAHALEQLSAYELRHGEAVALGLIVECQLAELSGIAAAGLRARVADLLATLGLPSRLSVPVEARRLLDTMRRDKKNREGQIHFALPARVGEMHRTSGWTTTASAETIRAAFRAIE